ncbi:RNA polymerase sigma factor [Blastopirellula marina]|uniref:RNA polymerase ECF-type sigma factor n=1 Tax=Blastopirellula marina DSM 3645 TaxID=314230 RepID=A4A108_9BACT|nr:sigma-70 family RNA polymerase sigma factor [Blastopirellula marina]EAQ77575.1 RNA polymerase ECF-type sigma factor [Blastopirellula marina DSM 3645]
MTSTPEQPTDGELLTAVLAGQREKFAEIVQRYQSPLLRLAMSRLGRQQEAEDAVQQTFLNAFRWLDTYDSRYSFRTWLWTILINNCNRLHQKSARRAETEVGDSPVIQFQADDAAAEPLAAMITAERHEHVRRLLTELTPSQAEAVRLRFFGQMKFQEIADSLGCTLPAAKARVRKGMIRLTELLTAGTLSAGRVGDHFDD